MNTTIIIVLVSLIIIIGIAIVVILLKGKKEDKSIEDNTEKTFQEGTPKQEPIATQEPQIYTPTIQEEPVTQPTTPPVMQDLNTPQPPPVTQTLDQPIKEPPVQTQQVPMQPVDNVTQDIRDLNQAPSIPTAPVPDIVQPNVPPSKEKVDEDMQTIMDTLNTPNIAQPPVTKPINQAPPIPDINTAPQATPPPAPPIKA
ncbi:TPA: hypothetical protein DEP90_01295 [Patescibacteria group bacterium]|nr:hypothetical protein [Patescibacteria group bacterium]